MLVGWWPLNGDTLDYSGHGYHATNNGATVSNGGKTGKCYEFTTNAQYIYVPHNDYLSEHVFGISNSFSLAGWVNIDQLENWACIINKATGGAWSNATAGLWVSSSNGLTFAMGSNVGGNPSGSYCYVSYTAPQLNRWYHVVGVADGQHMKLYIDGQLHAQRLINLPYGRSENTEPITIGRRSVSNSPTLKGRINDVRVYDHALSDREVKELAQAKILHYKFDDFQEPTVNYAQYNMTAYAPYYTYSRAEQVHTCLRHEGSSSPTLALKNDTFSSIVSPGAKYTISGYLYLNGQPFQTAVPHISTYHTDTISRLSHSDGYFEYTQVFNSGVWIIHSNMCNAAIGDIITIKNLQIEFKDHATQFVTDQRDGAIHDCSGYDNHGSLELATTPQWVSESKIGTGCYQFDGETSHILVNATTMDSLVANDFSITFWLNSNDVTGLTRDVLGGGNYGHTYGGVAFSHHSGNTWYYDIYTEPSGRHILTISDSSNIIPFNQWSHIVLSRNRSNSSQSIHVNGVKVGERTVAGSEDIRWNQSAYPLKIGKGHYNGTNGMIDDVRIYTTALSDADIKDLYQTRASLDNVGNLCTHELQQPFNFLDPKLFYKYANSGDPNYEVVEGRNTWSVWPVRFHPNGALNGLFKENTQYRIRTVTKHDTNYNDVYRPGGFVLFYTDGTRTYVVTTGGTGEWLTTDVMSDAGKTIAKVSVCYYTNYRVMIDIDESYMVEYMPNSITDKGVLTFLNYSEVGPTHGLIGWWPLDGHAKDLSGEGKHGTVYGATVATGINGMAYSFDGIDDYIDCGVNFAITNQLTLGAWVKMNEYTTYPRICGVENKWILYISPTGQLCWYGSGIDKAFLNSPNLLDGQWHHVMATYGGDGIDGYIDGTYINTLVKTGDLTAIDTTSLTIGGRISGSRQLSGTICDVRIYNRTLSPEEIKILYSATKPNPVAMQLSNTGVVYIPGQLKEV